MNEERRLDIQQLDEWIAPEVVPTPEGHEIPPDHDGDGGGSDGDPSLSIDREVPAGHRPQPAPLQPGL